jgi:hypothetical protein
VGVIDLAIVIVDNGLGFIHATLHLFPLADVSERASAASRPSWMWDDFFKATKNKLT